MHNRSCKRSEYSANNLHDWRLNVAYAKAARLALESLALLACRLGDIHQHPGLHLLTTDCPASAIACAMSPRLGLRARDSDPRPVLLHSITDCLCECDRVGETPSSPGAVPPLCIPLQAWATAVRQHPVPTVFVGDRRNHLRLCNGLSSLGVGNVGEYFVAVFLVGNRPCDSDRRFNVSCRGLRNANVGQCLVPTPYSIFRFWDRFCAAATACEKLSRAPAWSPSRASALASARQRCPPGRGSARRRELIVRASSTAGLRVPRLGLRRGDLRKRFIATFPYRGSILPTGSAPSSPLRRRSLEPRHGLLPGLSPWLEGYGDVRQQSCSAYFRFDRSGDSCACAMSPVLACSSAMSANNVSRYSLRRSSARATEAFERVSRAPARSPASACVCAILVIGLAWSNRGVKVAPMPWPGQFPLPRLVPWRFGEHFEAIPSFIVVLFRECLCCCDR